MKKTTTVLALFSSVSFANTDLTPQELQYQTLVAFNSTEMTQQEATATEGEVAPFVAAGAGGAILGAMGTIASNPNAGARDIASSAAGGFVAGALAPIMGGNAVATVAAGSLGLSVGGGCSQCHM